ncbi:MAG: DNA adenine methylase [Nanoarchaeota archaeon]|nr:DNA adenine methylase [Nanoarchaeota archaeon]MBU1270166.1 DNA adenine methylase [Nanoarchaeota archaeon]MBU1604749.1 DNA adenine methylase [Nanoarchaeota archaeon]
MNLNIPKFVKWAGGKTQLIEQFKPLFPSKIDRYFEPFVGGGAVLFYVIEIYSPKKVFISDINEELINSYKIVKEDVENLISLLKKHAKEYSKEEKEYYYKIRALDVENFTDLERAARFIFLNRTCFNGLYRVNSKGKFNVPIGRYVNPDIVREDVLRRINKLLQKVELRVMSFEKIVGLVQQDDFVYFDPPYWPINGTSFTSYTHLDFKKEDQEKLAEVFKELDKKGCKIMLSNSDTKLINDLYKNYKIKIVKATRMINSKVEGRGEINEVVITNY